jgi:hypothetical protein
MVSALGGPRLKLLLPFKSDYREAMGKLHVALIGAARADHEALLEGLIWRREAARGLGD